MNGFSTSDIIALVGVLASIGISFVSITSFFQQKIKDAEAHGQLLNRVSNIEGDCAKLEKKMDTNDLSHGANDLAIAKLEASMEYVRGRIDEILAKIK